MEAQQGREFAAYAQNLDLFEAQHYSNLSEWISERGFELKSESAYLATFSYIAGGWLIDTPTELVCNRGLSSLSDAVSATNRGNLDGFSTYDTNHSHRRVNPAHIETTLSSLESLSVAGERVDSFESFFAALKRHRRDLLTSGYDEIEAAHQTFETAWNSIQSISYFGPLSAFDWLEVVIFVHGHKEIAPKKSRPGYLNTGSNPAKGFEAVFGCDINDDEAGEWVGVLEDFARDVLNKSMPSAIFDMESALCVYYKDQDEVEQVVDKSGKINDDCLPNRINDC
ncbi:hypothetical protein ACFO0N_08500 [Halobium salinum]|uniref:Amino acid:DNA transferase domain-containing protein n=1 Tax=Halobium salinum TaxID=1364940 RepID=A0ABD5PBG8_9EURY|nr:hypothetical protein [Halobium salinum]